MFAEVFLFYLLSLIPLCMATSQQREPAEQSESGKALKGHIFKSKRVQDPHECLMFCYSELTCQSYNYVMTFYILSEMRRDFTFDGGRTEVRIQ